MSNEAKIFNYELIRGNVEEAIEELNRLMDLCEQGELDEADVLVGF